MHTNTNQPASERAYRREDRGETRRPDERSSAPLEGNTGPEQADDLADRAHECPRCGSTRTREIMLDAVPHHARLVCAGCGRWIKFLGAEWTLERARSFEMPYGMYKGLTMAEIAETDTGYLRWAAEALKGGAATAAKIVLAGNTGSA